jgi:hypothetical protein
LARVVAGERTKLLDVVKAGWASKGTYAGTYTLSIVVQSIIFSPYFLLPALFMFIGPDVFCMAFLFWYAGLLVVQSLFYTLLFVPLVVAVVDRSGPWTSMVRGYRFAVGNIGLTLALAGCMTLCMLVFVVLSIIPGIGIFAGLLLPGVVYPFIMLCWLIAYAPGIRSAAAPDTPRDGVDHQYYRPAGSGRDERPYVPPYGSGPSMGADPYSQYSPGSGPGMGADPYSQYSPGSGRDEPQHVPPYGSGPGMGADTSRSRYPYHWSGDHPRSSRDRDTSRRY